MAKDSDDNYKEGVDFEWVPMENQPEDGTNMTRRFFTKAEKKARNAPKVEAPKAAAPKADAPKAKPKSADKSPTADQKPKKRPADLGIPDAPTSSPRPPKRPFVSKVAGRGGYAAGNAAGMPAKKLDSKVVGRGGYAAGTASGMPGSAKTTTRGDRPGTPGGMPGSAKTTTRGDRPGVPASLPAYKKPRFGVRPDSPAGMPAKQGFFEKALKKAGDSLSGVANTIMEYGISSPTMKKGGVVKMKEGSAKDMREDKAMAKKAGMTMKQHEASAADKKHDAPKKMAMGGAVKKAGGGTMRGTGAAVRGKRFTGSY